MAPAFFSCLISYTLCLALQTPLPQRCLTISRKEQALSCFLGFFFPWNILLLALHMAGVLTFRSWFKGQFLGKTVFHHPIKEAPSTMLFAIMVPCLLSSWRLSLTVISYVVYFLTGLLSFPAPHRTQTTVTCNQASSSITFFAVCYLSSRHMVVTQQNFDVELIHTWVVLCS